MKLLVESFGRAMLIFSGIFLLLPGSVGATQRVVVGELITSTG